MNGKERSTLDDLGRLLIEEVYDRACAEMHRTITMPKRGNRPNEVAEAYLRLDENAAGVVRQLIIDAIDQCFAQFLFFLDEHEVPLSVRVDDGSLIDATGLSDGLAAEPYNEGGWIARFSSFKNGLG